MSIGKIGNSQYNNNKENYYSEGSHTNHETAYILPEQLCTLENREAIERALIDTKTRVPESLKPYYFDYQNKHQRQFLERVNLIGQLTFLSYFFVDWFLLPDIATLSGILRLSLVLCTLLINSFIFRYCKNIKILDSLLPVYVTLAAAIWVELLYLSNSPIVSNYIYAAVILILLGNLCVQVCFRYSVLTSFLISLVILQGGVSNI